MLQQLYAQRSVSSVGLAKSFTACHGLCSGNEAIFLELEGASRASATEQSVNVRNSRMVWMIDEKQQAATGPELLHSAPCGALREGRRWRCSLCNKTRIPNARDAANEVEQRASKPSMITTARSLKETPMPLAS